MEANDKADLGAGVGHMPDAEPPIERKTPFTTGISSITYPCGCEATGSGNLPEHCPDHPEKAIVVQRDGHGTAFDEAVHAVQGDGTPKMDSAGKYILKEHDYPGPPKQSYFGS